MLIIVPKLRIYTEFVQMEDNTFTWLAVWSSGCDLYPNSDGDNILGVIYRITFCLFALNVKKNMSLQLNPFTCLPDWYEFLPESLYPRRISKHRWRSHYETLNYWCFVVVKICAQISRRVPAWNHILESVFYMLLIQPRDKSWPNALIIISSLGIFWLADDFSLVTSVRVWPKTTNLLP